MLGIMWEFEVDISIVDIICGFEGWRVERVIVK